MLSYGPKAGSPIFVFSVSVLSYKASGYMDTAVWPSSIDFPAAGSLSDLLY